jgi:hypothetical protein
MKPTLGLFDSSSENITGSLSETQAEMNLVHGIFNITEFDKSALKFSFSKYPIVDRYEKAKIICEIMNELWPADIVDSQFENFRKFETFLSAIGKRDHFFHQFLVYLLGINIIDIICKNIEPSLREELFGFKKESDIYRTWLMAATAHDFGYPYHAANKIAEKLSDLYSENDLSYVAAKFNVDDDKVRFDHESSLSGIIIDDSESVESIHLNMVSFLKKIVQDTIDLTSEDADHLIQELKKEKDHGFISALLLCKNIIQSDLRKKTTWSSFKRKNIYKSMKFAMAAISLHNTHDQNIQTKITIDNNIYAFLLYFIDNIQDWHRSFLPSTEHPFYRFVGFGKSYDSSSIYLDYLLTSDSWPDGMVDNVKKGIDARKIAIHAPINIKKLGITVEIRYFTFNQDSPEIIKRTF